MYKKQRMLIISESTPVLLIINIVISFLLVMTNIYDLSVDQDKIYWFLILTLVTIVRFFIHYFFSNENNKIDFHFFGVVAAGMVWASFPYLFHESMSTEEVMITLIIFCGMSGGSVTLLSSDLRSAIAYISLLVFPYSIVLLISGDSKLEVLGFMGLVYGLSLCVTAVKSSRIIFSLVDQKAALKSIASDLEIDSNNKEKRISTLEQHDMLTGLLNRKSFISTLNLERAKNKQLGFLDGFIHIDIEKLHNINQHYGHQYGDHVITKIGETLQNIDRLYNSYSARYGNDEFTIYISVKSENELLDFIKVVKNNLSIFYQLDNVRVKPGYYIGYYISHEKIPVSESIRNAYLAVTNGKKTNLRISRYTTEIQNIQQRNQFLRHHLKMALDDESFFMNFQPIVRCKNNEIYAFEALIRWRLNNEYVSPEEFIPVAEEHGLIIELGKLVTNMALKALAKINENYSSISISINVSVIQIEDDDFIGYLDYLIKIYDVNPRNVHLEITETAMISNLEKLTSRVNQAKNIGVMISIDDFGTGFSSIAVLRNLMIDYIKIDKSYIDNICSCKKVESIMSSITKMAKSIDTRVVSEGVETEEQLELIREHQIEFYQGYLYSKPVHCEEAIELLRQSKKLKL